MYYVYLLKDDTGKFYIGRSDNLKQRIKDHLAKKVSTTKKMLNPSLFYYEAYSDKEASKDREKKLKQFGSSYNGLLKRLKVK